MGRPYSQDLRERVIAAMDDGGDSYEIAPLFHVSVSYIYKVLGQRRTTGETKARSQRHGPMPRLASHDDALRAQVAAAPDATLAELRVVVVRTQGQDREYEPVEAAASS
jgi:transposase